MNNFALEPGTLTAVGKAEPDVTQILASMFVEMLVVPATQRPLRVVHVDDESWLLELVSKTIRTRFGNVAVDSFQNGDRAWRALSQSVPDLLITDLLNTNVPGRTQSFGMNGYTLLQLLAHKNAKYPVLVLSGSLSINGVESRARQYAGPNLKVSFLKKPFSADQLYAELHQKLAY